jgi:hypothetical protein
MRIRIWLPKIMPIRILLSRIMWLQIWLSKVMHISIHNTSYINAIFIFQESVL